MIPDFPHNIRITLAGLKIFLLLCLCPVGWLSLAEPKKKLTELILLLYYEVSLVSTNLSSKLFRFHCARPTLDATSNRDRLHCTKLKLYPVSRKPLEIAGLEIAIAAIWFIRVM